MENKNKDTEKAPRFFAMALALPEGLNEEQVRNTVHAALFALNGAARVAGVGIVQGPMLKKFIKENLVGG